MHCFISQFANVSCMSFPVTNLQAQAKLMRLKLPLSALEVESPI